MSDITTLESNVVYKNQWMTVKEDKILRRKTNTNGIYSVVEKADFVVIIAIDNDLIYLVEQYRYPVKKRCWELPQGAWETQPNVAPEEVARAELKEETGLQAHNWSYVGFQYLAYGFTSQGYHIYLASDLQQGSRDFQEGEEDLIHRSFPLKDFEQMILNGDILDATTVNAYNLAKMKGML